MRKTLCTSALAFVAGYAAVLPMLGTPPKCGNEWDHDGICQQTTMQTCTAAAAATLLATACSHGPMTGPATGPMGFFITSTAVGDGANLGGLAGADAHCQKLASAAGAGAR